MDSRILFAAISVANKNLKPSKCRQTAERIFLFSLLLCCYYSLSKYNKIKIIRKNIFYDLPGHLHSRFLRGNIALYRALLQAL